MIYPLEQLKNQISKPDQQLIYHLILEQQETNRLLRELLPKEPEPVTPTTEHKKASPDEHIKPPQRRKRK